MNYNEKPSKNRIAYRFSFFFEVIFMAVIKDVAKLAGVSISTVSKYFNNPNGLSEPYRSKVAAAVEELNFKPNAIARGLRTKRTNTIALIVPDITNTFYVEVYNNIRLNALSHGYTTQLYTTEENFNILSELLSQLSSSKIDGIILCFLDEDESIDLLDRVQTTVPVALLSWDSDTQFNSAVLDLTKTMFNATSYLIQKGHTKIAYVNGLAGSRISVQKMSGYQKAMASRGLPIPEEYIYSGKYAFRTGYQAAKHFMQCMDPPTAIVAANDIIAIGCCKYLNLNGYHVPRDVSVVGMDGIQQARIYDPSITTMAIPIPAMCAEVISLMINKIEHPASKSRQVLFDTRLTIGRSTDENAPLYLEF